MVCGTEIAKVQKRVERIAKKKPHKTKENKTKKMPNFHIHCTMYYV